MNETLKQFDYRIVKAAPDSAIPFAPFVAIVVSAVHMVKNGLLTISSQLVTAEEIDQHVNDLKKDLDVVGKAAKAALLTAQNEALRRVKGNRQ